MQQDRSDRVEHRGARAQTPIRPDRGELSRSDKKIRVMGSSPAKRRGGCIHTAYYYGLYTLGCIMPILCGMWLSTMEK